MNYYEMTTEKLETLKSSLEEQINNYVGMPFPSLRSDLVTYEIDSVDSDEVLITVNHFFDGVIRDYTIDIAGGVNDDVEYNRYNADEEIIDGGYMSFYRLPKMIRKAVWDIYALYKELETIDNILDTRAEEEEEETEEESEEVDNLQKTMLKCNHSINKQATTKGAHTMKKFDAYNAYTVNRNFRYIAHALGFKGFDYDHFDAYFKAKLENDDKLGDLLEKLEDIESSQFLIFKCTKVKFYERHEYDILAYLKTYGYDDNDNLQSIEDIMCSRVVAYVTGVLSEYGY